MFYIIRAMECLPPALFLLHAYIVEEQFDKVGEEIESLQYDRKRKRIFLRKLLLVQRRYYAVCELLDIRNRMWKKIFFSFYVLYVPCSCYALYVVTAEK